MSGRRRFTRTFEKRKSIFNDLTKNETEISEQHDYLSARPSFNSILLELNFTADELRALYRAFKDVLPICRDSFREVYANIFPHGDVEQFADLIFDSLAQQAEHVTFTEFIKSYSVLFRGTMEEKLNWMYRLYDPRDTGKIELERILTIITATDDLIGTKAAPVISLDEREKQARQIVQKFDLQKKGWISREDFMTVCSQDQSILQSISALCSTNTLTI